MVADDAILTLKPGAIVKFDHGASLVVDGILDANGTDDNPVYFTSLTDDFIGGDTNEDGVATFPKANDWGFIYLETDSGKISLSNTIERYSNNGIIDDGGTLKLNSFASDKHVLLFGSQGQADNIQIPQVELFDQSNFFISNSTINGAITPVVGVYDGSDLTLKDSKVLGGGSYLDTIAGFNSSSLTLDEVDINLNENNGDAFGMYQNSKLGLKNSVIDEVRNGLDLFQNASASIDGTSFVCDNDGLSVFQSTLNITDSSVNCANDGIMLSVGALQADKIKVFGAGDAGIVSYDGTTSPATVSITNSEIYKNNYGIAGYGSPLTAADNSIYDNTYGAFNVDDSVGNLNLRKNWWGSPSGPFHIPDNFSGTGDTVSDNIDFSPWLHYDPLNPGVSSVLFIPGFEASRMYQKKTLPLIGEVEDKLWEPNANSDVVDMSMDDNGVSLNPNIYTRDVIDTENVLGFSGDKIYDSFMKDMEAMVANGTIADWRAVPYDWRLSPEDIVNRGILRDDGTISYNEELADDQVPYIINQLQQLANTSKDGKVSIVTHSNGGLVAKALIAKLTEMKNNGENDLLDSIDRLIMVAAPQIGTPEAVAALLHGYNQELEYGLILNDEVARTFGDNVPGAYGFLPSQNYFTELKNYPPIVFDSSVDAVYPDMRKIFGNSIDSFLKMNSFLADVPSSRSIPKDDDIVHPAVLNPQLLVSAEDLHQKLDAQTFPDTLKIYQIAGWGIPTVQNIRYFSEKQCISLIITKLCIPIKILSEDFLPTNDGDKTVVSPSATYIPTTNTNVQDYYLNIRKYSNDFNIKNSEHSTIFEIPYLRTLIKNILTGVSDLPNYVTKDKPTDSSDLIIISVPKKITNITVVNKKDGSKTGDKPKDNSSQPPSQNQPPSNSSGSDFNTKNEEIPGSSYTVLGGRGYIVLPGGGSYTISITGVADDDSGTNGSVSGSGTITVREDTVNNGTVTDSTFYPDVPVNPNTDAELDTGNDSTSDTSTPPGNIVVDNGDGTSTTIPPVVVTNPDPTNNPDGPADIPPEDQKPIDDTPPINPSAENQSSNNISTATTQIASNSHGGMIMVSNLPVANQLAQVVSGTANPIVTNQNIENINQNIAKEIQGKTNINQIAKIQPPVSPLSGGVDTANTLVASAGSAGQNPKWRLIIIAILGIVGLMALVKYNYRNDK